MSDDDKKAYKQLLLIAVLCIFAILFMFAVGTLYAEHVCLQMYFQKITPLPESCTNGALGKFALDFVALVIGTLGAIKLLGS